MASNNELHLSIVVDDKGTVKISQAVQELSKLKTTAAQAGSAAQQSSQNADKFSHSLTKVGRDSSLAAANLASILGLTLSLTGAFYTAERALRGWFNLISGGISGVEDYRSSLISAAAAMVDLSESTAPKSEIYDKWKEYFSWLWQASKEADRKVSASGREIFEAASEFAKRGAVAMTKDQVETIGYLVDKVKSLTKGMSNTTGQLAQEVRALMTGNINMGSQLAQELLKVDSNLKENLIKAVKQGQAFEYLRSLIEGMKTASGEMSQTWGSIASTIESVWQEIQIRAFGKAYDDVVKYAGELIEKLYEQGKLTAEGEKLAQALGIAWEKVKDEVREFVEYFLSNSDQMISNIGTIASALSMVASAAGKATLAISETINQLSQITKDPAVMALLGAAAGSRLGPAGAVIGGISGGLLGTYQKFAPKLEEYQEAQIKQEASVSSIFSNPPSVTAGIDPPLVITQQAPIVPKIRAGGGGEISGSGGGGSSSSKISSEEELMRITESLENSSLSRMHYINKEYQQWIAKIAEVGASYDSTNLAMVSAAKWRQAQIDKFNVESLQKTNFTLEELLKSSVLTEEERTKYASQYSENRKVLISEEVEELRKLCIPEDVLISYRRLQEEQLKTYLSDVRYQTERASKTSSILEEILKSEILNQEERTKYAAQYSEIRIGLVDREIDSLQKIGIPEDVLASYRILQEQVIKTQTETMKVGTSLQKFMEETFTQMGRNIQTGLADAIKALRSDTQNFGDFLVNLHESVLRILDQLAAKAITDWAAQYMSIQSAMQGFSSGSGFFGKIGGLFSGLFGAFFGGGGGGSSAGSSGGFSLGGYIPYALGGIIPGHFKALPIRAFQSGGVVDYPTLGLIAETGRSEAVLPLTRTSGGELGVKAVTGDGNGNRPVNVTVHIYAKDAQSFFRSRGQVKKEIGQTMRQISREM
ncbi:MAG: hypothetical protein WCR98_02040 [Saccharofermentanales bacterium]